MGWRIRRFRPIAARLFPGVARRPLTPRVPMSPFWPEMPELVEFRPPSLRGSSDSSADRWGWERPRAWLPRCAGRRPRECPWWHCPGPAGPGCRRARRPSSRWSRSPPPWPSTEPRGCPTSCTCAVRRRAASWPRWARPGTSPPPNPVRWWASSAPAPSPPSPVRSFPEGIQTAENLLSRGLIDAVVALGRAARPLGDDPGPLGRPASWPSPTRTADFGHVARARVPGGPESAAQLWEYVEVSRRADRIDSEQFLAEHLTDTVVLPGTMQGEIAQGALVALGRLHGIPVVVAATTDRRSGEPLTVGGLRTIRRGIALAQRWGLPVVTIVDTLGAQLSVEGEQSGIAGEISRVMLDLVSVPTPDRRAAPGRRDRGSGAGPARHRPDRRRLAHVGLAARAGGGGGHPARRHPRSGADRLGPADRGARPGRARVHRSRRARVRPRVGVGGRRRGGRLPARGDRGAGSPTAVREVRCMGDLTGPGAFAADDGSVPADVAEVLARRASGAAGIREVVTLPGGPPGARPAARGGRRPAGG